MGREQKPIQVSWSMLRAYEECGRKAKLRREGKRAKGRDARAYFHGTVTDLVMRRWLSQDRPELGQMLGMVDDTIDAAEESEKKSGAVVRWRSPGDRDELRETCLEAVSELEPLLVKFVLPYRWWPEWTFSTLIQLPGLDGAPTQVRLRGGVDILVIDPETGEVSAFDLKTTRDASYARITQGQSVFYDLGVEASTGVRPSQFAFLFPIAVPQVVYAGVGDAERVDMLARIHGYARAVWRGDDIPDPGRQCGRCDVSHACDAYRPEPVVGSDGAKRVSLA